MICTGKLIKKGNETIYLDDPKQRQRHVKYMTPQQKERFAKDYVRSVLEQKEKELWFTRMRKK